MAQFQCDPAVTIAAFVFVVYRCELCLFSLVLVRTAYLFQMVVERCPGQLSDGKQDLQFVFLPQCLYYPRFLRWRRSFSKTKACKFFK